MKTRRSVAIVIVAILATTSSCALTPAGLDAERLRLDREASPYREPPAKRAMADLPLAPTWQDVLERGFLANGDLEAAYADWKAALERVDIASAYPNTSLTLGYSYAFTRQRMKSFDRMTFSALGDSMENLSFPTKVTKAGEVALADARAAAERFRSAKFDLQRRVLTAWTDLQLAGEHERIRGEALALARLGVATSQRETEAGAPAAGVLAAELALARAENDLATGRAGLARTRTALNGLVAREPDAPLDPAPELPSPRPLPDDDAALLALGVERNPELAALIRDSEGRASALELARLQWIPDLNPSLVATGSAAQILGLAVVLPTTIAGIRGAIREAESMLAASEAMVRQARRERAAAFVGSLIALRESERVQRFIETQLAPIAGQIVEQTERRYAASDVGFGDMTETRLALLELRSATAEAWAMRERTLAELEMLAGTDLETLDDRRGDT